MINDNPIIIDLKCNEKEKNIDNWHVDYLEHQ